MGTFLTVFNEGTLNIVHISFNMIDLSSKRKVGVVLVLSTLRPYMVTVPWLTCC